MASQIVANGGFVDCCGGFTGILFRATYTEVPVGAWFMASSSTCFLIPAPNEPRAVSSAEVLWPLSPWH